MPEKERLATRPTLPAALPTEPAACPAASFPALAALMKTDAAAAAAAAVPAAVLLAIAKTGLVFAPIVILLCFKSVMLLGFGSPVVKSITESSTGCSTGPQPTFVRNMYFTSPLAGVRPHLDSFSPSSGGTSTSEPLALSYASTLLQ